MTPMQIIARQLADLEPYASDRNARAELIAAAEQHDQEMRRMREEVALLDKVVRDLCAERI